MSRPLDLRRSQIAEVLPYPWNCPTTTHCVIHRIEDELVTARCPLCRHVLVARQGRAGPYFFCGCPKK